MQDDGSDENEIGIQPSVRRIDRLSRPGVDALAARTGVLTPFPGLLAGRRRPPSPDRQSSLSYLTLEPLVVAGLSSYGDSGTGAKAGQAGRSSGESAGADVHPGGDGGRDRLTVREYIRRENIGETRQDSEASGRTAPERAESPALDTGSGDGDERPGDGDDVPGSPGDRSFGLAPDRREPLTVVDRWQRSPSDTDRRPASQGRDGGEGVPGSHEQTVPADSADDSTTALPDRPGNAGTPEEADHGSGRQTEPLRGPTREADAGGPGAAEERPALVVRDSGTPERTGRETDRENGPTESERGSERTGRSERATDVATPKTSRSSESVTAESDSGTDRTRSPLAFDSVTDPAFDRFVETLARRLERRERIERERRGM